MLHHYRSIKRGKITFPGVVRGLIEIGVESCLVDFAAKQKTRYLAGGTTHAAAIILERGPIAAKLDNATLVAATRGAPSW
jgi:hypothetical protein